MKTTRRNFVLRSLGALAAIIPRVSLLTKSKQPRPGYITWGPKTLAKPKRLSDPLYSFFELFRTTYIWKPVGVEDYGCWLKTPMKSLMLDDLFVLINPDGEFVECAGAPAIFFVTDPPFVKNGVQGVKASRYCDLDPEQFAHIGADMRC